MDECKPLDDGADDDDFDFDEENAAGSGSGGAGAGGGRAARAPRWWPQRTGRTRWTWRCAAPAASITRQGCVFDNKHPTDVELSHLLLMSASVCAFTVKVSNIIK